MARTASRTCVSRSSSPAYLCGLFTLSGLPAIMTLALVRVVLALLVCGLFAACCDAQYTPCSGSICDNSGIEIPPGSGTWYCCVTASDRTPPNFCDNTECTCSSQPTCSAPTPAPTPTPAVDPQVWTPVAPAADCSIPYTPGCVSRDTATNGLPFTMDFFQGGFTCSSDLWITQLSIYSKSGSFNVDSSDPAIPL